MDHVIQLTMGNRHSAHARSNPTGWTSSVSFTASIPSSEATPCHCAAASSSLHARHCLQCGRERPPTKNSCIWQILHSWLTASTSALEASLHFNSDAHRSDVKRNAEGISRSLGEVFAYLSHGTSSLEEAQKLLAIITNSLVCESLLLFSAAAMTDTGSKCIARIISFILFVVSHSASTVCSGMPRMNMVENKRFHFLLIYLALHFIMVIMCIICIILIIFIIHMIEG